MQALATCLYRGYLLPADAVACSLTPVLFGAHRKDFIGSKNPDNVNCILMDKNPRKAGGEARCPPAPCLGL